MYEQQMGELVATDAKGQHWKMEDGATVLTAWGDNAVAGAVEGGSQLFTRRNGPRAPWAAEGHAVAMGPAKAKPKAKGKAKPDTAPKEPKGKPSE